MYEKPERDDSFKTLRGHVSGILQLAFSPDGTKLASGSADHTIKLWDVTTGKVLHTMVGHEDKIWALAYSPDGLTIASGGADRWLYLWDTFTGERKSVQMPRDSQIRSLAFSPDGSMIAIGSNSVILRDSRTGTIRGGFSDHYGTVDWLQFSLDGSRLVSSSISETIIWNIKKRAVEKNIQGHSIPLAFKRHPTLLTFEKKNNVLRYWDGQSKTTISVISPPNTELLSFAISPEEKIIAIGALDNSLRLYNSKTGKSWKIMTGHYLPIESLKFSPDGKTIASGSLDNQVKLWRI
ncbi:MAG: WD40 repeat domain-containing protein [Candidatus Sigynarchaeota archaeon]